MSIISVPQSVATPVSPAWISPRVYAKFWRLHFYAGFIVAPLIIWLCVTGILYILAPQVESLLYADLFNVPVQTTTTSLDAQLGAAQAAYPQMMAMQIHPSKGPGKTAYVVMMSHEEAHMTGMRHTGPTENVDVFINPYSAQVVGSIREDDRYSRMTMNLHGNLYMGDFGRLLTELGTVWSLALVLSGVYLWIPQRAGRIWGVWLPRIEKWKGRMWWRDFHSVGGTYLTILVLLFLATALMITLASGTIFALTRVVLRQTTPSVPVSLESIPAAGETPIALQELVAIAQENNLGQSYMISLPANPGAFFTISADNGMAKPELRQNISVDQYSGKIVHTTRWKEYPFLTKLTVWGLSFHFGDLFGITNLVLGILACLALIFFTISGVVMWWKRRPANTWGLPRAVEGGLLTPFPKGLTALIVVLCVLQPTLGISLLIALGVDWLVLRLVKKRTKNAGAAGEDAKTPGVKGKI